MASLSQALRLGDLPPPHRTFQGHATHIIEWSMMLRPNDSWSTCIPQGIATFLHYASRRSAGLRYATDPGVYGSVVRAASPTGFGDRGQEREGGGSFCEVITAIPAALPAAWVSSRCSARGRLRQRQGTTCVQ